MSEGKIASQAGHAFLGAFINCKNQNILNEYHKEFPEHPGTKICLKIPNLAQLFRAELEAKQSGLSTFRVTDSGCSNFYGGQPTITALGIGPATKSQISHITNGYKLL
jgi:peptidyl-tRNA hydrolase